MGLLDYIMRPRPLPPLAAPGVGMTPSAAPNGPQLSPLGPGALGHALTPGRVPRPGLLERLMPTPSGLDGLLGDGDASEARHRAIRAFGASLLADSGPVVGKPAPSLGQALGHALQSGQGTFDQSIEGAAGRNVSTAQLAQQMDKQARENAFRQRAAQLIRPGMTQEQQYSAWQQIAAEAAAAGVDLGGLSNIITATKPPVPPRPTAPQEIRVGNKVLLRDPATGKVVGEYPIGPTPKDPNAPDQAAGLTMQRNFQREDAILNDFDKATTADIGTVRKLQGALNELPNALAGNGASQVNMLYAFVSAMDPASSVREGEIGLAQAAAPLRAQALALVNKYMSGDKSFTVPKEMLQNMGELMWRRTQMAREYLTAQQEKAQKRATDWKIDPSRFTLYGVPPATPNPRTSTGSNPMLH